jgi:comEA protein
MSAKSIGFATRILSVFLVLSLSMGPLGIIPARAAGILHVTSDGTGTCSDWVNACSLQTALTDAVSGDEIWVQAGLYKPTTDSDRSATFQLKSGVAVYGGFAGTESARSERDFATNITTLSGDLSGNDNDTILPDEPTRAENSYHVVTGASDAILDGFTVTAGNANGETEGTDQGGGLYNIHSNTIIQNMIFSENIAASIGGGIYAYESQPQLENVTFLSNWGAVGGGMVNRASSSILTDVKFINNSSYMGGGMRNMFGSNATLTRVVFSKNSAGIGGGMNNLESNPILTDVIFVENTSTEWAGFGGGMHNSESAPILLNVTFDRNIAIYGGGIRNDQSNPILTNVTFSENSAISGGGEYDDLSNPTILNSTFTGNSATDRGGGIFNTSLPFQIDNTIFWGNTAPNSGSQIMSYGGNISNTVMEGDCPEGLTCTNIITADPKLGTLGDYGGFTPTIPLLAGSSAIDAGDDVTCPATDQRGIFRPQGVYCDIGAYESQTSNVLYATPSGLISGACSSWATACDLQYALTNAVSGQEIWVQAGFYKPTTDTDRAATFQLKSGVSVYGGFAGTESARSERDFATNVTTLSGDLLGNDNDIILPDEPTRADNSYHAVTGASGAILDGFAVTAGNANGTSFPDDSGGGLLDIYSGSILTNILFLRNTTSMGGGGMFSLNSDTVLTDVTFRENNASSGGGICSLGSNLTITRGIFDNNSAASTGGGMYALQENTSLTDVAFIGNTADMGGGLYNISGGLMYNITFFDNSAVTYGGGLMNSGVITVNNATFAGNSADNGGGFADTSNRTSILTNVTFYENTASTHGGGIFNLNGYITIRNSILWGNTDLSGLQMYDDWNATISDSVIEGECSPHTICTNIITDDPLLGTLGDYGGFTQTIPIEEGSPAIDATSSNCPLADQRGLPRSNPACDIGAFELVDTTSPETTILTAPPALDNDNTPTFTFNGDDGAGSGVASFLCRVDNDSFAPCTSPFTSPALEDGSHSFEVYAIDLAGNTDPSPAAHAWSMETEAPIVLSITRASPNPTDLSSVDFTVTFSEPVTGVDTSDFNLLTTKGINGANITSLNESGTNYTITVNTGTFTETSSDLLNINFATFIELDSLPGIGPTTAQKIIDYRNENGPFQRIEDIMNVSGIGPSTFDKLKYLITVGGLFLRLDIVDDDTIIDIGNNNLGGPGLGNGNFTDGQYYTINKMPIFADVPFTYWANTFIERLYASGITGGCSTSPKMYCPEATVTRAQMAVFLLVAEHGTGYTPPDATDLFNDVPASNGFARWIEQLYNEGITGGCGGGNYCPNTPVTREQMSVFLLVAEHGTGYTPPAATGVFADVPVSNPFAPWIEALAAEGITGGCGGGNFCPKGTVTRAQMAVFLVTAFNLP